MKKNHILKDMSGKTSSVRVGILIVTITLMGVYVAHNVVALLHGNPPVSIGTTEVSLLTLLFGAKVAQRFGEKDINKEEINDKDSNKS